MTMWVHTPVALSPMTAAGGTSGYSAQLIWTSAPLTASGPAAWTVPIPLAFNVNEAVASMLIAVPLIVMLPVASSDMLPVHLTSIAFVSELILMLLLVVLSTRMMLGEAGVSSNLIEWPAFVLTCTLGDAVVSS